MDQEYGGAPEIMYLWRLLRAHTIHPIRARGREDPGASALTSAVTYIIIQQTRNRPHVHNRSVTAAASATTR